ncbi:hypothetical protein CLU79DRAFT_477404 [Phycomyces nitens]|nr:hypothetical protein CLU79DRAFT_477404 [Phycomyces nitens]
MVSFRISCLPRENMSPQDSPIKYPNQADIRRTDRNAPDPQRSRSTPTDRHRKHQWKSLKLINTNPKDISESIQNCIFSHPIHESLRYSTLSMESNSTDSSTSLVLQANTHAALVSLQVKSPTEPARQMEADEVLRIRGHNRQSSDPGNSFQPESIDTLESRWNSSNQSTLECLDWSENNVRIDDDNGKAMILEDWHRASLWNVDWSNLFSTHTELWRASQLFDHLISVRHSVQDTNGQPVGFGHNWTDPDPDEETQPTFDAETLDIKGLTLEQALK